MQRQPVKTDFSRPAGLPMATIRTSRQGLGGVEGTSDDYMKQLEEEWNRKIDDHVEVLTQNMQDLVDMAKVRPL
jgi:mediator of RNA polymerase II transcription subunit 22